MIVAYNHTVNFPFDEALDRVRISFPDIDLSGAATPIDLERILMDAGEVLYVEVDFDEQIISTTANEKTLEESIAAEVGVLDCPDDQQTATFDPSEIEDFHICDQGDQFPEPVPTDELEIELQALEAELADITNAQFGKLENPDFTGEDETSKVMECVGKCQEITTSIDDINKRENKIRTTRVNLEEFLYNYRIMDLYHTKRLQRLDDILNIFNPLVTEKLRIEDDRKRLAPILSQANRQFAETKHLVDIDASHGLLSAQQIDSLTPPIETATSGADETFIHLRDFFNARVELNARRAEDDKLRHDLIQIRTKIGMQASQISAFLDADLITVGTDAATELTRQQILQNRLQGLFSGFGSTIYGSVNAFTSRTSITPRSTSAVLGQSFDTRIEHTMEDELGLLAGRPKTYASSNFSATIIAINPDVKPHGTLYDKLYNIWGDDQAFFTREERGLTASSDFADQELVGTGAEVFKDSFIASTSKFREFYENYPQKWEEKVNEVKNNVIEPALGALTGPLETMAIREVEFLLAFGQVFETVPARDAQLLGIINYIRESSAKYSASVVELRDDLAFVQTQHAQVQGDVLVERAKYQSVPCAVNTAPQDQQEPTGGNDPFGSTSLVSMDPNKPNPTKWCYWVKFAKFATAVNVLPLPGPGGFRYWPIGLVVPSPAGPVRIPLPIVWIPLAVIPLQVGIFVIFIGQCGVCPSPVVFYSGPNGEKKFIISLRPGQEFGASANDQIIKTITKGGIAVNKKISDMLKSVNVPVFKGDDPDGKASLLDDVKDKILKKVQKLPSLPDVSSLNGIGTGATVTEKRKRFRKVVLDYIDGVDIPSMKFPKNANTVNPKPPPVSEIVDQLRKSFKMALPQIAIPATEKINLKTKLIGEVGKLQLTGDDVTIESPPSPGVQQTPEEKNKYLKSVRASMRKAMTKAKGKITPEQLGVVAEISQGVSFVNPYQCKGTIKGLSIPPLPPLVVGGLVVLGQLANSIIDGTTADDIIRILGVNPANAGNIGALLAGVLDGMPNVEVPNPSKVSIKDMLKNSAKQAAKMQLPSLPDPTKPPQIRVTMPGDAMKGSIKKGVGATIDAFPINDINFQDISPIDMKQVIVAIIEDSFAPLEEVLNPLLNVVSKYKAAKDKTFPETLGLSKVSPDTSTLPTVTKEALAAAMEVLKALALVPYPAVAAAPQLFSKLHPILSSDDLPPWERFTLDNFLLVCFLDLWCKQGKKTSGLFENP